VINEKSSEEIQRIFCFLSAKFSEANFAESFLEAFSFVVISSFLKKHDPDSRDKKSSARSPKMTKAPWSAFYFGFTAFPHAKLLAMASAQMYWHDLKKILDLLRNAIKNILYYLFCRINYFNACFKFVLRVYQGPYSS
jgi:hypothetical protein